VYGGAQGYGPQREKSNKGKIETRLAPFERLRCITGELSDLAKSSKAAEIA
jgi:hypothetical protein